MDQENGPALSSAFPPPPPYYKSFTSENLQLLKSGHVSDSADKKRELQYLVPPPAPVEGSYTAFGDVWRLPERLPSLTEMGVTQLYSAEPGLDRTVELRTLTKSVLLNYLELVGIMGVDPAGWVEKIEDIRILFINMHHLLNEYRPHQARETLCMMMEEEIGRTRDEIRGIEEACEKVEEVLAKVNQGDQALSEMRGESLDIVTANESMDGEMEDIVETTSKGDNAPTTTTISNQKWFEDEKLMELWNGVTA